MVNIVYWTSM